MMATRIIGSFGPGIIRYTKPRLLSPAGAINSNQGCLRALLSQQVSLQNKWLKPNIPKLQRTSLTYIAYAHYFANLKPEI